MARYGRAYPVRPRFLGRERGNLTFSATGTVDIGTVDVESIGGRLIVNGGVWVALPALVVEAVGSRVRHAIVTVDLGPFVDAVTGMVIHGGATMTAPIGGVTVRVAGRRSQFIGWGISV